VVFVILGIIAAIAVPAIGNIVENSKKDAHVANAQMLLDAAKLAEAQNVSPGDDDFYSLAELTTAGLIDETPKSPSKQSYDTTDSGVDVSQTPYVVTLASDEGDFVTGTSATLDREKC
jgi:type IV pilus assembly protein PilA